MTDYAGLTLDEAHRIASFHHLAASITNGPPATVTVGRHFFHGFAEFGTGAGETHDDAFVAAIRDYLTRLDAQEGKR